MTQPPDNDPLRTTDPVQPSDVPPQANATIDEIPARPAPSLDLAATETRHDVENPGPGFLGRFVLEGEIGRGGMGCVFRGRDPDLDRDLALKILLPQHRGQAPFERRFLEEARIAGQLEHPGVPAVHELGRATDGRPFFAMKLIRGQTLADLLKARPEPTHELPRFLAVFEQVCQTIAYAHAHGVIHRDLKPANVMVGKFGEVQVMDWGLAKVLAERDEMATSVTPTSVFQPSAEALSQAGNVLGTPSYMAPEQARGQIDKLDKRADVFGLGAILCEILTGQPPFLRGEQSEIIRRAARGEVGDALGRLDGCDADVELIALAKRCLAAEASDRPRDAGEVTAAVTAYREGVESRLRRAELDRAAAVVRAVEERKRQRVQLALALAVLTLVVGGGGVAWWAQQQAQARAAERTQRQRDADATAKLAMKEAGLLLEQAKAVPLGAPGRFGEALAAARKAEELARAGEASEDVHREAEALVSRIEQEEGLATRDRRLLTALLEVRGPREGLQFSPGERGHLTTLEEPSADEQFAAAFRSWGLDVDETPTATAAAQLGARPPLVVTEIVAALDEWASERRQRQRPPADWKRPADLAAALDEADSGRRELREILGRGQLWREKALGALSVALRPVPIPFDAGWGHDRSRLRRLVDRVDVAREPVLGLLTLVRALRVAGDDGIAERLLRGAVRARPQDVVLHDALGKLLSEWSPPRWREAAESFATARALRPELGESLANALVQGGHLDEGLALYHWLVAENKDSPWLHDRYALALDKGGRPKEAEAAWREAVRLQPNFPTAHSRLALFLFNHKRFPEAEAAWRVALRLRPDWHLVHITLGGALSAQGRHEEAEKACREGIRLKPEDPSAHEVLAKALLGQNRFKESEAALREALRLKPDFSDALGLLGVALHFQGKAKAAEAVLREALRLNPTSAEAHGHLGSTLGSLNRFQEAEAEYREAVRLKPDLAELHYNLGIFLSNQNRLTEAETSYREALRLEPDYPEAHANLGSVLNRLGRGKEAETEAREAVRLRPKLSEAQHILGTVLMSQRRYEEATTPLREATRLKSDYFEANTALGLALFMQARYKEAEAAFREAVRIQPQSYLVRTSLGDSLSLLGRHQDAEVMLREAIRLGPWHAPAHDSLGKALTRAGRIKDAEAPFREAIRLDPGIAEAHRGLGAVLDAQRRFPEAEASYRAALRYRPAYTEVRGFLANNLLRQGRYREAEKELRAGIRLQPDFPPLHLALGFSLSFQRRHREAEACFREALRLQPDFPQALLFLGTALQNQGRFAEALVSLRRGHDLGSKLPRWPYPSAEWVRACERLVEWDRKLSAVLRGEAEPENPQERITFATLCGPYRQCHATAARFYAAAFAAEPNLAANLQNRHRYNAACDAALAGCGRGTDCPRDEKEGAALRRQAQEWLRADLALLARQAADGNPRDRADTVALLRHWQSDPDLSGVRHSWSLLRRPAAERQQWLQLWQDVAALLKKAGDGK